MKTILGILSSFLFVFPTVNAQDLLAERIRKITPRKRSIYFNKGIFHNGGVKNNSTLKAIRHSYSDGVGYERIVFDYKTNKVPRIYGNITPNRKEDLSRFFQYDFTERYSVFW